MPDHPLALELLSRHGPLAVSSANRSGHPPATTCDEAVGQLDSTTARFVMDSFVEACSERGLAVLLVTHSREVAALGTRIVSLTDGRLEMAA